MRVHCWVQCDHGGLRLGFVDFDFESCASLPISAQLSPAQEELGRQRKKPNQMLTKHCGKPPWSPCTHDLITRRPTDFGARRLHGGEDAVCLHREGGDRVCKGGSRRGGGPRRHQVGLEHSTSRQSRDYGQSWHGLTNWLNFCNQLNLKL